MLGTLINFALILLGSFLGIILRKGLPERMNRTVMCGLGLATVLIGLNGALKSADTLCIIVCVAVGSLIGSALDIEHQLDRLGRFAERKLGGLAGEGSISKGFVTASLVFCVGAMAIVGSINSGIHGDHSTLIAKAVIDGIASIVFASTLGVGVALSAVSVLVYQGTITLLASALAPVLTEPVILEMGAVGGLLVAAIGMNMIYDDKHIPVGNMLPAIFLPLAYLPIAAMLAR